MITSIIVGLGLLALVFYRLRNIRCTFVCELRSGKVNVIQGHVPSSFVYDCRQMMRGRKVVGMIRGIETNGQIHLHFSDSIHTDDQVYLEKQFPHKLYSHKPAGMNSGMSLD